MKKIWNAYKDELVKWSWILPICPPNRRLQASVGTLLWEEEKTTLLNLLKSASREWRQVISPNILNLKDTKFMILTLGVIDKLVINRVKLESTKRAFFIKGQIFLINVYESSSSRFISFYMHILRFLIKLLWLLHILSFILLFIHSFLLRRTHVDSSFYNWNGYRA